MLLEKLKYVERNYAVVFLNHFSFVKLATLTKMTEQRVQSLTARAQQLDQICEAVKSNDSNLRERAAELSQLLIALRPALSDAERAYFRLLRTKETEVVAMEESVDGLHKFVDSHPAIFRPESEAEIDSELLDEKRLLMLQENIDRQNETIAKLVTTVRELQTKIH